jgi:hypothetical protein
MQRLKALTLAEAVVFEKDRGVAVGVGGYQIDTKVLLQRHSDRDRGRSNRVQARQVVQPPGRCARQLYSLSRIFVGIIQSGTPSFFRPFKKGPPPGDTVHCCSHSTCTKTNQAAR